MFPSLPALEVYSLNLPATPEPASAICLHFPLIFPYRRLLSPNIPVVPPQLEETFICPINYPRKSESDMSVVGESFGAISFEINWKRMVIGKLQTATERVEQSFTANDFPCAFSYLLKGREGIKVYIVNDISSLICRM